jgi:hypothetical protein
MQKSKYLFYSLVTCGSTVYVVHMFFKLPCIQTIPQLHVVKILNKLMLENLFRYRKAKLFDKIWAFFTTLWKTLFCSKMYDATEKHTFSTKFQLFYNLVKTLLTIRRILIELAPMSPRQPPEPAEPFTGLELGNGNGGRPPQSSSPSAETAKVSSLDL